MTVFRVAAALVMLAASLVATSTASADSTDDCGDVRAATFLPAAGVSQPSAVLRVHAIQMKQEIRHVESYDAYATKIRCLFEDLVRPNLSPDLPDLVVYPEYAGLATLGLGSRGAPARAIATGPTRGVPELWQDSPGAIQAFGTLAVTYGDVLAYYRTALAVRQAVADPEAAAHPERSFALTDPRRAILLAATDTVARAFMEPNSRLAREEGVFVVSSAALPILNRSDDPLDVAVIADPDLVLAGEPVDDVWIAADARVWNKVLVWSPQEGQTAWSRERFGELDPADPRANLIHINRKAPTTPIEEDFLALTEGDMSAENTGPFTLDGVPRLRFSIANSLPAFMWGTREPGGYAADFGEPVPEGQDPCGDPTWWVRCLDARGTNVIIQTEANPAPWADYTDPFENWQPLVWMESSWRHVADPTVGFRYTVTPWLVGNLVDIPFDGQANIKRRDNPRPFDVRTFVGNRELFPDRDPETTAPYAGPKVEFLVTAPWVEADDPTLPIGEDRERLRARAQAMLAGSNHPQENDYLETSVWADLTAEDPPPEPPGEPPAHPPLPATGGGVAAVAVILLVLVAQSQTRSRRKSPARRTIS